MMLGLYLILGIIIYLLVTSGEDHKHSRRRDKCISCGKVVDYKFLYCPHCGDQIKKNCDKCGKLIESDWRYCPFCGGDD